VLSVSDIVLNFSEDFPIKIERAIGPIDTSWKNNFFSSCVGDLHFATRQQDLPLIAVI
jgi:hypothetical protein